MKVDEGKTLKYGRAADQTAWPLIASTWYNGEKCKLFVGIDQTGR